VEEAEPAEKKAQKGAKPGKEKAIETSDTVEEVVEGRDPGKGERGVG
jgi:hypothetical protein